MGIEICKGSSLVWPALSAKLIGRSWFLREKKLGGGVFPRVMWPSSSLGVKGLSSSVMVVSSPRFLSLNV